MPPVLVQLLHASIHQNMFEDGNGVGKITDEHSNMHLYTYEELSGGVHHGGSQTKSKGLNLPALSV